MCFKPRDPTIFISISSRTFQRSTALPYLATGTCRSTDEYVDALMHLARRVQLHQLHRQFVFISRVLQVGRPPLGVPAASHTAAVKGTQSSTSKKKRKTRARPQPLYPSMAASPLSTATVNATAASLFAVQNLVRLCKDLHLPISYKVGCRQEEQVQPQYATSNLCADTGLRSHPVTGALWQHAGCPSVWSNCSCAQRPRIQEILRNMWCN